MRVRAPERRRIRVSSVVSEACRNVVFGSSRPLLVTLLAVVVLGGIAAVDIRTIVGLSVRATEFRESGATVQLFSAPAAISGQRCEALGSLPGVLGSGATKQDGTQVKFLTAPGSGIATVEATAGLQGVLGLPENAKSGIWLSETAADTLGAEVGTALPTSIGPTTVIGHYHYPADASDRSLAHAAIAAVPPIGNFDACWVSVWPSSEAIAPIIRATYAGDPAEQSTATFSQLNTRLGAAFDGPQLFHSRATSAAPLVAAVFGLVLGFGCIWARRLELASALHAQMPKSALVAQVWLELLALMLAAVTITLPATYLLAAHANPDAVWPAWSAGLRAIAAGALTTLVGGALAAASTSERRLFHYFKDR